MLEQNTPINADGAGNGKVVPFPHKTRQIPGAEQGRMDDFGGVVVPFPVIKKTSDVPATASGMDVLQRVGNMSVEHDPGQIDRLIDGLLHYQNELRAMIDVHTLPPERVEALRATDDALMAVLAEVASQRTSAGGVLPATARRLEVAFGEAARLVSANRI
jgi:hypothetical protein